MANLAHPTGMAYTRSNQKSFGVFANTQELNVGHATGFPSNQNPRITSSSGGHGSNDVTITSAQSNGSNTMTSKHNFNETSSSNENKGQQNSISEKDSHDVSLHSQRQQSSHSRRNIKNLRASQQGISTRNEGHFATQKQMNTSSAVKITEAEQMHKN